MKTIKINEMPIQVNSPDGVGTIEDIIITGIGVIQVRVKYESNSNENDTTFIKYNVGNFEKLLKNSKLKLIN